MFLSKADANFLDGHMICDLLLVCFSRPSTPVVEAAVTGYFVRRLLYMRKGSQIYSKLWKCFNKPLLIRPNILKVLHKSSEGSPNSTKARKANVKMSLLQLLCLWVEIYFCFIRKRLTPVTSLTASDAAGLSVWFIQCLRKASDMSGSTFLPLWWKASIT